MGIPETPLEMAQRHVREGALRVSAQEELVARLRHERFAELAAMASDLLRLYCEIQQQSQEHLSRLQDGAKKDWH